MYTQDEAYKLAKYYKDKVIGQDLDAKGVGLKNNRIDIDEVVGGGFNVYCYANASSDVIMYNKIQLVAEYLKLPTPDDVLKEINKA